LRTVLLACLLAACGDHLSGGGADAARSDGAPGDGPLDGGNDGPAADARSPLVDARPYDLYVPPGYHPGTPTPLVVMLHGYSADADLQEAYFRLRPVAEAKGFLYARPNGTVSNVGLRFWNATDACCNLGHADVDDVAYLRAVIDDVAARYTVDPRRVYLIGHSNGGFMSHRLACELADRIAAIVSFAGDTWSDPARCTPSRPVSILQVHGTLDAVIAYNGGRVVGADAPYPAAETTVAIWRTKNGCTGHAAAGRLDVLPDLLGDETEIDRATGCPAEGAVELWTMRGAGHIPVIAQPRFPEALWSFLAAHPRS